MTYFESDVPNGAASLAGPPPPVTITEPVPSRLHPRSPLTLRQCEVIALTARGLRAKQIAYRLGLSVRTIEKHKHDVMRKLRLHSTIEVVRWYLGAHDRLSR